MVTWAKCAALVSFLTLASTAFAAELNYQAMDKLGWKLSCQAYTFGRNGVPLDQTLKILNQMGVRYVELFPGQKLTADGNVTTSHDMPAADIERLQDMLKDANVKAVAYGVTGVGNNEASARKVFEWAKKMGIENIVCEPDPAVVPVLDKLAEEYGIKVAFHNHPKPSPYWDPQVVLDRAKGTSQMIGACADTGHWPRSGLVPVECLKKLEGRIIELHFKDLNKMGEGAHDVPWGTGVCDFKGMLNELKRQSFKGVFSIEYEIGGGQELQDNVTKCVQNFSAACAELAR